MRKQIVHLSIPGEPQGKQRIRARKVGGGKLTWIQTYTPATTVNYETYIKQLFAVKYPDFEPVETALEMELTARLQIPSSTSKIKKLRMQRKELRPTKKPDVDNVLKIAMDALETLAYKNDSQIVSAITYKYYSYQPAMELIIWEIRPDPLPPTK